MGKAEILSFFSPRPILLVVNLVDYHRYKDFYDSCDEFYQNSLQDFLFELAHKPVLRKDLNTGATLLNDSNIPDKNRFVNTFHKKT